MNFFYRSTTWPFLQNDPTTSWDWLKNANASVFLHIPANPEKKNKTGYPPAWCIPRETYGRTTGNLDRCHTIKALPARNFFQKKYPQNENEAPCFHEVRKNYATSTQQVRNKYATSTQNGVIRSTKYCNLDIDWILNIESIGSVLCYLLGGIDILVWLILKIKCTFFFCCTSVLINSLTHYTFTTEHTRYT